MKPPTLIELDQAIQGLADHHTGRECLRDLLAFFKNQGRRLDLANQECVRVIIEAAFTNYAGTTVDLIQAAIQKHRR